MEKKEAIKEKIVECCKETPKNYGCHNHGNAIYGLGVVGAMFYFLKGATTFTAVIIGIGKSIFWPAILMFKLLTYLQL